MGRLFEIKESKRAGTIRGITQRHWQSKVYLIGPTGTLSSASSMVHLYQGVDKIQRC